MEQEPTIENKEKKKISKIHFLIHPGYLSDEKYESKYNQLLERYIEKAKDLKDDELMFAFPATNLIGELKNDIKENKLYMRTLKTLKDVLGDRLIVLAEGFNFVYDIDENVGGPAFEKMKRITEARGFTFDRDVFSEAYGEMLPYCVVDGAKNLSRAGKLRRKTVVKTELTDASVDEFLAREDKLRSAKSYKDKLDIE